MRKQLQYRTKVAYNFFSLILGITEKGKYVAVLAIQKS